MFNKDVTEVAEGRELWWNKNYLELRISTVGPVVENFLIILK